MLQIRGKERQNDLYAKSCFVLHERTSRYALTFSALPNHVYII